MCVLNHPVAKSIILSYALKADLEIHTTNSNNKYFFHVLKIEEYLFGCAVISFNIFRMQNFSKVFIIYTFNDFTCGTKKLHKFNRNLIYRLFRILSHNLLLPEIFEFFSPIK